MKTENDSSEKGGVLTWHDLEEKETYGNNSGNGKQPLSVWRRPQERMGSLCSQGLLEKLS